MDGRLGAGDASTTTGRENGEVSLQNDSVTDTSETNYSVQKSIRRKRKRRELTNFFSLKKLKLSSLFESLNIDDQQIQESIETTSVQDNSIDAALAALSITSVKSQVSCNITSSNESQLNTDASLTIVSKTTVKSQSSCNVKTDKKAQEPRTT